MLTDKEIARALLSVLESTNFLGASIEQVLQAMRWLEAIGSGAKEVVAAKAEEQPDKPQAGRRKM